MEMQGLKPSSSSISLQGFPPTMPPPSMREAVGAGTHETAAAMVKAADAL
jgi:hypothetical protein